MYRVWSYCAAWIAVAVCNAPLIAAPVLGKTVTGKVNLPSIQVISFAPDGVLLIGDGSSSQIVAVETGDTQPIESVSKPIVGFQKQLAAHLGAPADGIEILDIAVNPASGRLYVAVRRQADKRYIIATVGADGVIGELDLDHVKHALLGLASGDGKVSRVTDVAWADDRIVAAGRSSDTFSSRIFSISAPLNHESTNDSYSAETYHVSHGKWETKAPMSVMIPFREDGKTYVVGAFSCTPVVKYPLDALQPGANIKGQSVMELGSGNQPIDMFLYTKDGKAYVLSNTFRFHHERSPFGPSPYWTVKFEQGILSEDAAVNETALRRLKGAKPGTERVQMIESWQGVMQMDKLGEDRAVVLRKTENGIDLEVLPLP